jgi:hypothetical protein
MPLLESERCYHKFMILLGDEGVPDRSVLLAFVDACSLAGELVECHISFAQQQTLEVVDTPLAAFGGGYPAAVQIAHHVNSPFAGDDPLCAFAAYLGLGLSPSGVVSSSYLAPS